MRTLNKEVPVGTIMGPNADGELLVVRKVEDGVSHFGFATVHDIKAADLQPEPRSVTEARRRGAG